MFLLAVGFVGLGIHACQKWFSGGARPSFVVVQKVAINRASAEELIALPGIGPVMVHRIIEDRRRHGFFLVPEDLLRVKGISKKTLGKLRWYLRFD